MKIFFELKLKKNYINCILNF